MRAGSVGAVSVDDTSTVLRVTGVGVDGNSGRRVDDTNVDGDGARDGKRVPVSPKEKDESVASRTGASVPLESAARSLRIDGGWLSEGDNETVLESKG